MTITGGGENADVTIYKYGDADKNGKVDQSDLALLQKYSAGWNVTVDKPIADVTLDGKVNGEDIALMQKYFAGWNVTLGKVS